MVYDYVSPQKNGVADNNKYIMVFEPSFLYESLRNYILLFIISGLILFFLSSVEIVIVLFLGYPVLYFLINVLKLPLQLNFIRMSYHFILSIFTFFLVVVLEINSFYREDPITFYFSLLASIVIFIPYYWKGKKIFYLRTNKHQIEEKNNQHEKSPSMDSHTMEELIIKLGNLNDWKLLCLIYYFTFLLILVPIWALLLPYWGESYIPYTFNFIPKVIAMFDFFVILFLLLGLFMAFIITFFEKNLNLTFQKDIFLIRAFLYSSLSLVVIVFLISLRIFVSSYNDNNNINPFSGSFLFSFLLLIPLMGIIMFYNSKKNAKDRLKLQADLVNNPIANNLTKYYLLTQLSEIKNVLSSSNPLDFDIKFKIIIESNLLLLKTSFLANDIKIKSTGDIKQYVLQVASPLRESLREAIGKNFTELYLSDSIPSDERVVNYDEIWTKVNKTFLQWESTSTNNEGDQ